MEISYWYTYLYRLELFQAVTAVMEEIKDPKKTFPKAVVAGVGLVTIIYVLINLAFFMVLSPDQEFQSNSWTTWSVDLIKTDKNTSQGRMERSTTR